MKILRTPDSCFEGLPDFPFAPNFVEVGDGLRMHYVDEGPRDAPPVLLLHGEPTWSYLYRKMIPPLVKSGFRAIAPDLIGFGKSDKPAESSAHSYLAHVTWMHAFVKAMKLSNTTLFGQDWGSLIGLRVIAENGDAFSRLVIGNGFLPTARGKMPLAFRLWRGFAKWSPVFPIGRIVATGCVQKLSNAERAAYDAPFPSREFEVGPRMMPKLVPGTENDPATAANRAAWEQLGKWNKPFLALFGKNDPILGKADRPLIKQIPGGAGQPHERFWGGHFVQEDRGAYLAERMIGWMLG
ncbi:MAG: haloalkane dehalogenase [Archangium sp.]